MPATATGVARPPWHNGGVTLQNMTSRQLRPVAQLFRVAVAALVLAVTLAATGCSLLPSDATSLETTGSAPTVGSTAAAKAPQSQSAADVLAAKVKVSLTKLGNATKSPNRQQMTAAMVEAGASKEKVEVSIDKTPTGLAVDAIEAAAPMARQCIIGQVRDGKASIAVLPLLASGRCFVGDQH